MTDYIDREAFLASKVFLVAGTLDDYDQGYMDGVDAVEEAAKEFPAADVRPVVRGKWVLHEDGSATCSNCKTRQKLIYDDDSWQHYCGNCGAQMDVGKN